MTDLLNEYVFPHWPFFVVMGALWLVGHFMEKSVFTKARCDKGPFWYWGRESMELHPLFGGLLIGLVWIDPEGKGWSIVESMGYFAGAGILSLGTWWGITYILLPKFGIKPTSFRLPGESEPPGSA